jgi:glutamyl-tRNA reductase
VQRYDIDHLRDTIDANLARRQAAVPDVERIIEGEAACYLYWLNERQVVPALVELRRRAEELAGAELERTLRRIEHRSGPDKALEQEVTQMAHRIVAKLLHSPTVRLKAQAASGNGDVYAQVLEELFALGQPREQGQHANGNGVHG